MTVEGVGQWSGKGARGSEAAGRYGAEQSFTKSYFILFTKVDSLFIVLYTKNGQMLLVMFLFSRLWISLAKHGCTKLVNYNKLLTVQFLWSFVKIKSTVVMALKTLRALRKKAFYLNKRQRDRLIKEKGPHRSVNFLR